MKGFPLGNIPANKGRRTIRKCDVCPTVSARVCFYKKYQKLLCDVHYTQFYNHGRILWVVRPHKSPEQYRARRTIGHAQWRKAVFERDGYACQRCGKRGVKIQADHDLPHAFFPELRSELLNGQTLCEDCHQKSDTWGRRGIKIYGGIYTR